MNILFTTDILKHPVNHAPTNHDWLVDLWFPNKTKTVTKINNILDPENSKIGKYLPKKPYTSVLQEQSISKITEYLGTIINSFDYIIAFECTNETRSILKSIHPNILFVYFSPLRYSHRQTFTLSSNNNELQQKIDIISNKAQSYYIQQANYVKNLINNKQPILDLKPNSILLIGQVENDLSVWNGEKYTNLDDYFQQIMELASKYDAIYYKPHPFSKNNNDKIVNAENIINTDIEIYRLLSSDSIEHVVTVSSSVAKEAQFFGKKVTQFSNLYISEDCKSIPYTMSENFWNYLLNNNSEAYINNLEIDVIDIRPIRNTYWGYKFIMELESTQYEQILHLQDLYQDSETKYIELQNKHHELKSKHSEQILHLQNLYQDSETKYIELQNKHHELKSKHSEQILHLQNLYQGLDTNHKELVEQYKVLIAKKRPIKKFFKKLKNYLTKK